MLSRRPVRVAAFVATATLALTGIEATTAATAGAATGVAAADGSAENTSTRPDSVSAMVTARATGKRVEDLSQRAETELVFANPDGTWTSEADSEPTRMQDEAGEWHDIDTTLVERAGYLEPKYAASDVRLSDGGDRVFAELSEDGKDLAWKWPSVLPEPQVEGDTATYVGAVEGGDLVVTATSTGFSHSVVLHERPASLDGLAEELAAGQSGTESGTPAGETSSEEPSATPSVDTTAQEQVQFSMPIATDGGNLAETAAGAVQVTTKTGEVVATAPKPLMWDSSVNGEGDPANVVPVETTVTAPGATTPEGTTAGANPVLTLSPDVEFLAGPETVYPVTIDPTFTTYVNGDTWIEKGSYETSQAGSQDLKVGTYDGGTHIARSYLTFSSAPFTGKYVTAATLWMRNYQSNSCSAADILVQRIIDPWTVSGLTWTNRPNFTGTNQGSFSTAYGSTGCPANGAHWDVTSIAAGWASGAFPNYGLQVRANTETANVGRRFYRSTNYPDPPVTPRMIVTYTRAPNVPPQPLPTASATYAPPGSSAIETYLPTLTPTFSTTVSDPDGGAVRAFFEVTTLAGTRVSSCYSTAPGVASGSKASCTVTTPLTEGSTYYVRATALDGYQYSGATVTNSTPRYSSNVKFTVAATTPAAPVVSCPAPYTEGSWNATKPSGAVTCTVTATGDGASAPGFIEVTADRQSVPNKVLIPQSTSGAVAQTTVTIPADDGGHGVVATAISPSGKKSAANDYGFGWGEVGLSLPLPDQVETTTDTVALEASGPKSGDGTSAVTASVKWRVAGTNLDEDHGWNEDTETDLTAVNSASGVHVSGTWDTDNAVTDTASGSDPITLDKDRPVLLDVQVCIDYPGAQVNANCTWASASSHRQVLRVAHAFGGNFPTADVPGGQVALFTGELAVGDSDATVGAPGADLSVSRTASSFAGPVANPANQVFGPGWNASLDGPDAGLGDMTLIDNTLIDGTLQLVDGLGTAMIFGAAATPTRRTAAALTTGDWVALDEDTQQSATQLKVNTDGSIAVTEDDSTVTTYEATTAPSTTTAGVYAISKINEAGTEGATTYSRDSSGRITRMLAPATGRRVLPRDRRPAGRLPCHDDHVRQRGQRGIPR